MVQSRMYPRSTYVGLTVDWLLKRETFITFRNYKSCYFLIPECSQIFCCETSLRKHVKATHEEKYY